MLRSITEQRHLEARSALHASLCPKEPRKSLAPPNQMIFAFLKLKLDIRSRHNSELVSPFLSAVCEYVHDLWRPWRHIAESPSIQVRRPSSRLGGDQPLKDPKANDVRGIARRALDVLRTRFARLKSRQGYRQFKRDLERLGEEQCKERVWVNFGAKHAANIHWMELLLLGCLKEELGFGQLFQSFTSFTHRFMNLVALENGAPSGVDGLTEGQILDLVRARSSKTKLFKAGHGLTDLFRVLRGFYEVSRRCQLPILEMILAGFYLQLQTVRSDFGLVNSETSLKIVAVKFEWLLRQFGTELAQREAQLEALEMNIGEDFDTVTSEQFGGASPTRSVGDSYERSPERNVGGSLGRKRVGFVPLFGGEGLREKRIKDEAVTRFTNEI